MTTPIPAHAGHWFADLLYVVPVAIVVVFLGIDSLRQRKKARDKQEKET